MVYPNPASQMFYVEQPGKVVSQIQLYDLNGKLVKSFNSASLVTECDVSNLEKGMYILEISDENQRFTQKIVVE